MVSDSKKTVPVWTVVLKIFHDYFVWVPFFLIKSGLIVVSKNSSFDKLY